MSKAKGPKSGDPRREQRRSSQFAALRERAAADAQSGQRREHIQGVDVQNNEQKYEPLLYAIESALAEYYDEREQLPIDEEAERAVRLVIARFEGDSAKRVGSADVDGMADRITRNIEHLFRRHPLLSRAEIIGCLRRIIGSIATWHSPSDPRAYFRFVGEYVADETRDVVAERDTLASSSGLWVPGQREPEAERPAHPGGIWLPGDP